MRNRMTAKSGRTLGPPGLGLGSFFGMLGLRIGSSALSQPKVRAATLARAWVKRHFTHALASVATATTRNLCCDKALGVGYSELRPLCFGRSQHE